MKYSKHSVYFDIDTKAIIKKVQKKVKGVTQSHVARAAIKLTPFDKMVEELNAELGN